MYDENRIPSQLIAWYWKKYIELTGAKSPGKMTQFCGISSNVMQSVKRIIGAVFKKWQSLHLWAPNT